MQFTTAIIKFEPISRNYKMPSFYTYIYIYIYGVPLLFWKYCTSVVLPGLALITNQSTNTVNTGWYYFPWYFHLVCIEHCIHLIKVKRVDRIIHLLTGNESNNTFIVPKVPSIFWGNAEENGCYRGDNKSATTRISSL